MFYVLYHIICIYIHNRLHVTQVVPQIGVKSNGSPGKGTGDQGEKTRFAGCIFQMHVAYVYVGVFKMDLANQRFARILAASPLNLIYSILQTAPGDFT